MDQVAERFSVPAYEVHVYFMQISGSLNRTSFWKLLIECHVATGWSNLVRSSLKMIGRASSVASYRKFASIAESQRTLAVKCITLWERCPGPHSAIVMRVNAGFDARFVCVAVANPLLSCFTRSSSIAACNALAFGDNSMLARQTNHAIDFIGDSVAWRVKPVMAFRIFVRYVLNELKILTDRCDCKA